MGHGEGVSHFPLGVRSENFLKFYIKMASCRAFLVAKISYRLAACFTQSGRTCGIEIGDCSSTLGTIIAPSRKLRAKMTKTCQKVLKKLCENCVVVLFVFILLQIFRVADWGHGPQWPPDYAPGSIQIVDHQTQCHYGCMLCLLNW